MKIQYKGYDIEVVRHQCLGGWSQLYMSIFRISDGYCVEDTYCETDDTVREMIKHMKARLDAEIEEHGEGEWTYDDPEIPF